MSLSEYIFSANNHIIFQLYVHEVHEDHDIVFFVTETKCRSMLMKGVRSMRLSRFR